MFVTNWISTTKIQKISEITNFFRHYFLSRTEVFICVHKDTARYVLSYLKPFGLLSKDLALIGVVALQSRGAVFQSLILYG